MRLTFIVQVAACTALAALNQSVQAIPITGVRETSAVLKRTAQSSHAVPSHQPALVATEYGYDQIVPRAGDLQTRAAKRNGGRVTKGSARGRAKTRAQTKKPASRSPSRQGSIASTDSRVSSLVFAPPSPNMQGTRISHLPPTTDPPAAPRPRPSRWQRAKTWVRQKLGGRELEGEELALVERDWADGVEESLRSL